MSELMQQPADILASLGRHWGWVLAYGIITLLAGVAVLAWPGVTLLVVAVLLGVQLIVSGIFRFVAALAPDRWDTGTAGAAWRPVVHHRAVGRSSRSVDSACAHHIPGHLLDRQRNHRSLHRPGSRYARTGLDRLHGDS